MSTATTCTNPNCTCVDCQCGPDCQCNDVVAKTCTNPKCTCDPCTCDPCTCGN